jgi:hypothetical protein
VKPAHAIDGFHPVGLIRFISVSYATLGRLWLSGARLADVRVSYIEPSPLYDRMPCLNSQLHMATCMARSKSLAAISYRRVLHADESTALAHECQRAQRAAVRTRSLPRLALRLWTARRGAARAPRTDLVSSSRSYNTGEPGKMYKSSPEITRVSSSRVSWASGHGRGS